MVDLSSEFVEKDLHIEQMGTQVHELQEQVEVRGNTIEVLENQLHDLQLELDDAKEHLEMHPRSSRLIWRWMRTSRRRRTRRSWSQLLA
jgi:arginyl-tRNA synthetase